MNFGQTKMASFHNTLEIIESIKTKLTDQEYKELIETLAKDREAQHVLWKIDFVVGVIKPRDDEEEDYEDEPEIVLLRYTQVLLYLSGNSHENKWLEHVKEHPIRLDLYGCMDCGIHGLRAMLFGVHCSGCSNHIWVIKAERCN